MKQRFRRHSARLRRFHQLKPGRGPPTPRTTFQFLRHCAAFPKNATKELGHGNARMEKEVRKRHVALL